jgi:DNA-binding MarR family transcriptional regulator
LSRPTPEGLFAWRLFLQSALALLDVLEHDFVQETGIPLEWYDALVHLEDAPDGLRMSELAEAILYSKSGLTRVVDRMEKAGLVRRYRPDNDRRSVFVLQTPAGREAMNEARPKHHDWIARNFTSLLSTSDVTALTRGLSKISANARIHRPGRVSE